MESPTLEALRLLELITVETEMAGRSAALAAGISNHTIIAVAIARELLRKYSSNAFIAGLSEAIRFAYSPCARQIDLTFPDMEHWAPYLPSEAELTQDGAVEGFVFDLLRRCDAETLTAVWGRMIYPYIQTIKKRKLTMFNQREKTGLPIRWVSASTDEVQIQKAWAAGLTIANAARPLVGDVAWNGRFRSGVYYACGDFAELGDHWRKNDASEIRLISDAEVLRAVIVEGHKRGFGDRLKTLLYEKFTPEKLAEQAYSWFDMPFSTDLSAEDFQQLLTEADWSVPDQ